MANGNENNNGNAALKNWRVAAPASALGLLFLLGTQVGKDATIALDVARQHGEELLQVNMKIASIERKFDKKTYDRYTGEDATRDLNYMQKDINRCIEMIRDHEKEHHNER